jgi:tripartite-type tricarboxylate transporter receptor subunit TctC
MVELGFPEVDANVWVGLLGTLAMPTTTVAKVHRDVASILQEFEFRIKEIEGKGYELVAAGPVEFKRHMRKELSSREAPIRYSGAKVD